MAELWTQSDSDNRQCSFITTDWSILVFYDGMSVASIFLWTNILFCKEVEALKHKEVAYRRGATAENDP